MNKNVNKCYLSGSVASKSHDLSPFAMSCSSKSIGHGLGMSMNSRSDWLKSAEHYGQCYQWMEKAYACPCSHKGLICQIFSVTSWKTGQLDHCQPKWQKSGQNMLCVCYF